MDLKSLTQVIKREKFVAWVRFALLVALLYLAGVGIEALWMWQLNDPNIERELAVIPIAARVLIIVSPFLLWAQYLFVKNIKLNRLVMTDPLTGLASRACLESQVPRMLATERRQYKENVKKGIATAEKTPLISVRFFDLDGLKVINDSWGHHHGNEAIKAVGHALKLTFSRESDLVARLGGDEFVAVSFHDEHVPVVELEQKFTKNLKSVCATMESVCGFTVAASMGHTSDSIMKDDVFIELLKSADAAMYEQKRRRKSSRK